MKRFAILAILVTTSFAQQGKVGGTGSIGGLGGVQLSRPLHLAITTASLPDATANTAYSQTVLAANGVPPYNFSIAFGSLPLGLTLNSATGAITGTPTALGSYTFTVVVFDAATPTAGTATMQLTINVFCTPLLVNSISPLPPALKGTAYNFNFQSTGGNGTVTWAGTGIPAGLTLSSAGALTGTPTIAGTNTLNVTATDSCPVPQSIPNVFILAVNSPTIIQTASPLPPGVVGTIFTTQFTAAGGTAPYTWSVIAGALPNGLALATNGTLTGTPTVAGTFTFTVQAVDSATSSNSKQFTLTVTCPALSITSNASLPDGTQNAPYSSQLQKSGGSGTVTWALTSGTLPNGVILTAATGKLSGIPTNSGTFTFTISATDSCSTPQSDSQTFTLVINQALTITTLSPLPAATEGTNYNLLLAAQGGVPPYTWTVPSGPIPNGAIDVLDYFLMPLPDRNSFHLSGSAVKYFHLDSGLIWWLKGAGGSPWDGEMYDAGHVYQWFTEGPTFSNASGYKKYINPVPLWPRYFVPGTSIDTLTPGPNRYDITESCGTDNLAPIDNLDIKGNLSGPFTDINFGGSIPNATPYLLATKYIKGVAGIYSNREQYWLVKGFGQVQWQAAHLSGGVYVIDSTSINNNKVSGGAPVPNFACKLPNLPVIGALPPGVTTAASPELNLSDSTGLISGIPAQAGTSNVTIQVEDSVGTIAQSDFVIVTSCPAFSIGSTSPLPAGSQASPYSFQFQSSGGILPIIWSVSGTLPTGMTLSTSGKLSGTPSNFGTFLFTIFAQDSCAPLSQARQATFNLTINANSGPLAISNTSPLPGATEGTVYSQQLSATGGTTPYAWTIPAGALPAGMSMTSAGLISGTSTSATTANFTAKVTDNIGTNVSRAFALTTSCPAFSITSGTQLPNGVQGSAYSDQLNSLGGILPVTWAVTGGALPTGITLSSSGRLSGTPTVSGSFSATITATDFCSPTPQTAPVTFSLTIAPTPVPLAITTGATLPAGMVGIAYGTSFAASGGTAPYFWSLISGTLPGGLTLTGNVLSGTPTTAGTFTPTIQVTDNVGATASRAFTIVISCPTLAITSPTTLPNGTQSSPYTFQLASSGGIAPITYALTGGAFPTGVSVSSSGLISGTPSTSGIFSPQVTATDSCSTPQTSVVTFSLTIAAAPVPLSITTSSPLPVGTVGKAYNATVSATGGTPPYGSWTVTAGALPTGLSLSSSGVISGTPTTAQTTTPTIRVTDNVAATASKAFSITINPATVTCGPPAYLCSRTDTAIVQTPTIPNFGGLRGAGTVANDPDFKNPIARITDARFDNLTYQVTNGSDDQNKWNTDSTFLALRQSGGRDVYYNFNTTTMASSRMYVSTSLPNGLRYPGSVEWSRSTRTKAYQFPGFTSTVLQSVDVSNCVAFGCGAATVPTPSTVFDFKIANCLGTSYVPTWTDDGGVADSDTAFAITFSNSGGQGGAGAIMAAVYVVGKGCIVLNTHTGAIVGNAAFTGGSGLTCATSCTGQVANWTTNFGANGFSIHNNKIGRNGDWLVIVPCGSSTGCGIPCSPNACQNPIFWHIGTNVVTIPLTNLSGHFTEAHSTFINQPSANKYGGRPFTSPITFTQYTNPLAAYTTQHAGWNNADAADTYPFLVTTLTTATGAYTTPYTNEIIGVLPSPAANKIWRFVHHFNSNKNPAFSIANVIGSVSQDGNFFMFGTDMMGTLGSTAGTTTCVLTNNCRGDVFAVRLK